MNDLHGKRVLAIEYHQGTPFSVLSESGTWDFEDCVGGELVYHESGSGGTPNIHKNCTPKARDCQLWVAGAVKICFATHRRRTRRKRGNGYQSEWKREREVSAKHYRRRLARWGWRLLDSPIHDGRSANPFEWSCSIEGRAEYCTICDGYVYDEEGWAPPCDHLQWCEDCGVMGGRGAQEFDGCDCWKSSDLLSVDRCEVIGPSGHSVSLEDARHVYAELKKYRYSRRLPRGLFLDSYKVRDVNEAGLVIGCQFVSWEAIDGIRGHLETQLAIV